MENRYIKILNKKLIKLGIIEKLGKGKATYYKLKNG